MKDNKTSDTKNFSDVIRELKDICIDLDNFLKLKIKQIEEKINVLYSDENLDSNLYDLLCDILLFLPPHIEKIRNGGNVNLKYIIEELAKRENQ